MPVFLKEVHQCLFIHVPKTGGSSFEERARLAGWQQLLSIDGFPASRLGFLKCSPQHFHGALLESLFHLERFDERILICRDPVVRMKSEYYWQVRSGVTHAAPSSWITSSIEEYRSDALAHDNHLRPQTDFLPSSASVKTFKLEEDGVRAALDCLERLSPGRPGLAARLKAARPRRRKRSLYEPEVEQAFADEASRIRDFYASDCEAFGY